jgi:hypothetical protein
MGICTDIMHDFVLQEIKRIYSSYDGWKITPRVNGNNYDTVVLLERMVKGHREIVKVLITFKERVTPDMLEELKKPEKANDGIISRYDFAVIVPGHADTSALLSNVRIYSMKSFAFEGKELIWIKKPVRKTQEAPSDPAAKQVA